VTVAVAVTLSAAAGFLLVARDRHQSRSLPAAAARAVPPAATSADADQARASGRAQADASPRPAVPATTATDAAAADPGVPRALPPAAREPDPARRGRPVEGWLRVATQPHWAEVYVDGRRRGSTPLLVSVALGRRQIRLVNAQIGRSERHLVTVRPEHTREAPATLSIAGF
jgi:hypothetical protein